MEQCGQIDDLFRLSVSLIGGEYAELSGGRRQRFQLPRPFSFSSSVQTPFPLPNFPPPLFHSPSNSHPKNLPTHRLLHSLTMNIFRFAGDMTHLISVLVLLLKIYATKSCSGNFSYPLLFSSVFCLSIALREIGNNCLGRDYSEFSFHWRSTWQIWSFNRI